MPNQSLEKENGADLSFVNLASSLFGKISKQFENADISLENANFEELHSEMGMRPLKVLGLPVSQENFLEQKKGLEALIQKDETLSVLVLDEGLELEELIALGEHPRVFSILEPSELNKKMVQRAIEHHVFLKSQSQQRQQIKQQNKKLETLNENLENLVYERTKKEYQASQATEASLKKIQSIFGFIKNVSKCHRL